MGLPGRFRAIRQVPGLPGRFWGSQAAAHIALLLELPPHSFALLILPPEHCCSLSVLAKPSPHFPHYSPSPTMLIRTADFTAHFSWSWKHSSVCSRVCCRQPRPRRCSTHCTTGSELAVAPARLRGTNVSFSQQTARLCTGCQVYSKKHLACYLRHSCSFCFSSQIPHLASLLPVQQALARLSLALLAASDPGRAHVRTECPSSSQGWQERFGHNESPVAGLPRIKSRLILRKSAAPLSSSSIFIAQITMLLKVIYCI